MPKYRKKPVVIEAFQMTLERRWDALEWPEWLCLAWQTGAGEGGLWPSPDFPPDPDRESAQNLCCGTIEGVCVVVPGTWIIKGVKGEIYPCAPDVFELTYDEVGERNADRRNGR